MAVHNGCAVHSDCSGRTLNDVKNMNDDASDTSSDDSE